MWRIWIAWRICVARRTRIAWRTRIARLGARDVRQHDDDAGQQTTHETPR